MNPLHPSDPESLRLAEDERREKNWKRWGPYLAERQWGTVREDYSADGNAWEYFPHDHARSRAYRWGEDGILGITDRECRLCFALAMWNGRDPILKERLFGLTNGEGNHGEDVKEEYFYLDATPTSSYLKGLYKYPQDEYPYAWLVAENRRRGRNDPEFEICDTGVFDYGRYFDVFAEYAKAGPDDVLIRITVANRGREAAELHLLPTLWFRNTWSWGCKHEGCWIKPRLAAEGVSAVKTSHATLEPFRLVADVGPNGSIPDLLVTENETNRLRVFDVPNDTPYVKDSFHGYVIHHKSEIINPKRQGTKAAFHYKLTVPAGSQVTIRLRLSPAAIANAEPFGSTFDATFAERIREADTFYAQRSTGMSADERRVARQAYAGLLWSKQFYHYVIEDWLEGDPAQPTPPASRKSGRNRDWKHLFNRDVVSMPDKWEYPWYASWDLAFQLVALARIDPAFAKDQVVLFLREWYMHPNGQMPAYEFGFDDVNPPLHAWAAMRIYKMSGPPGKRDRFFLERVFQKLVFNFTWWVNRKDPNGRHLFSGGFLGMDNVSVFDRSQPLPNGAHLEQADGTAWMAGYCLTMLSMALELASEDPSYEDVASKFFEHFVAIVDAVNTLGGTGLWDETDGFYYDRLQVDGRPMTTRIRSMVGLVPIFAGAMLEEDVIERLPGFRKRMQWFLENRRDLARHIACCERDSHGHRLLAIPSKERLQRALRYVLDESEFLSPYGIRSLSRHHRDNPFVLSLGRYQSRVEYTPGESTTSMFGGNANWRGPVWFPMNYLLIEALERYHGFYGDEFKVECPVGSGMKLTLLEVAREIKHRLTRLFLPGADGVPPFAGSDRRYADDPHWRDLVLFHEYFHGDDGRGLGATHQTGWTGLVARLLEPKAPTLPLAHAPAETQARRAADSLELTRDTSDHRGKR